MIAAGKRAPCLIVDAAREPRMTHAVQVAVMRQHMTDPSGPRYMMMCRGAYVLERTPRHTNFAKNLTKTEGL